MLKGTCHCGDAGWALEEFPQSATACNCTVCRRYGVLWAYGYMTTLFVRSEKLFLTSAVTEGI